jgi:cytochrome c-type biogenesis protein CcmH/NrfG
MKYPVFAKMQRPPVSMMIRCRNLGLAVLVLSCQSLAFSQTPESQIEPISSALRARDYDKAVKLSRAALEASPNNAQLWTLQGIALASKGESKDALTAFQRALKISPNTIAALAGAAQIEYQAGNAAAMPLLNHLLQLRPEDPTAHAMLAVMRR